MASNIRPLDVTCGTIAGVPLVVDFSGGFGPVPVKVTLTKQYIMLSEDGMPSRPSFTGSATAQASTMTLPSGFILSTFAPEAAALVAANAAVYA